MTSITYNINDVEEISKDFKNKFIFFDSLEEGDKLIIDNNEIYIDKPYYFQFISRWWNGQNKNDMNNFLSKELNTYIAFIQFIKAAFSNLEKSTNEKCKLLEIYRDHKNFIKIIISGLEALKITYKSSEEIYKSLSKLISKINNL